MYFTLYPKNRSGGRRHLETVINAMPYQPDDSTRSICDNQLTALCQQVLLTIRQIVAD